MVEKLILHKEVTSLDMENGITYVGQFLGVFNVALTNYFMIPTMELVNLEREKNKSHIEVLVEKYNERKDTLNKDSYKIEHNKIVSMTQDIFKS